VRSTPQRRESWARQIQTANAENGISQQNLILILDVKTRWSSTHQMLRMSVNIMHLLFLIFNQVVPLTIAQSLTVSLVFIEISGHIPYQVKNGKRLN
jgi:hypothetical protein